MRFRIVRAALQDQLIRLLQATPIEFGQANGIDYEEEIDSDHVHRQWILTDVEHQHYDWGIDVFERSRSPDR